MLNAQAHVARNDLAPAVGIDLADEGAATTARHGSRGRRRISAPHSRIAYSLGIAVVCAVAAVDLVTGGATPATAGTQEQSSIAVADALGIEGSGIEVSAAEDAAMLEQLAASRAQRDGEQAAAAASQAQAEQAFLEAKAAEEARLAAEAAAAAEAEAAAAPAAEEAPAEEAPAADADSGGEGEATPADEAPNEGQSTSEPAEGSDEAAPAEGAEKAE